MANAYLSKFHGYLDATVNSDLVYRPEAIWGTRIIRKHTLIQERKLSYRFYPHFHPYTEELDKRLIKGSVRGLQATDTDYRKNPDGTWAALPNSTYLTLPASTPVILSDDRQVTLDGSTRVTLFDGALATLSDGTNTTLPGTLLLTSSGGMRVMLPGDKDAILQDSDMVTLQKGTSVTLPAGTLMVLQDGKRVSFPGDTKATLFVDTKAIFHGAKPRPILYEEIFSPTRYNPNPELVDERYPVKDLDFTSSGAYAVYNWELFFHAPLSIAINLSKNQRFEEAQYWFHYIFDPTDDSEGPTPERFWKVKPFQYTDVRKIEEILVNLSTGADPHLRQDTINSIEAWKDAPFRPHVVARYRQTAYMFKTVMAYLDNLIDWGDSLFRQDTGESIDEASMIYVLAANILGLRPQAVPKKGSVRPQTYASLKKDLNEFGNALAELEASIPFDIMPHPNEASAESERFSTLSSIGKALYFCVPRNDKLLSYWDTVADRLFKIRNSLNIQGIFRQLPLFEPPIDPAMLARAAAAGLDVGSVINGLNQPLPLVRFQLLVQKAAEIVQEVKSLGNNLLSAMEKEDGEAMAILRAKHERVVMEMVEHVKYGQLQDAIKSREGLLQTLALAVQRYTYYERQMGKKPDEVEKALPQLVDLDKDSLDKMRFAMKEPEVGLREVRVDIAQDLGEAGGKMLSSHEVQEMKKLKEARDLNDEASTKDKIAAGLSLIPELGVDFKFWGIGGHLSFGGSALSRGMSFWASFAKTDAEKRTYDSGNSSRIGSYSRRELDWAFQSNLAAGEITQIFKQIRAAEIRQAIAELELKNHRQQMKHAEEIERFLNEEGTEKTGKKTNKALYAWMKREVKGLYVQCFQFAFDIAKKAERALQHELGNPELSYLQFGYLAGKEGLLAGEKLYLDIKRMEMAYHDLNQREYELTKHVSLLQINPLALLQLRTTGRCTVTLPETVFDMDGPGHYFRRIRTVALSIPCVTGPYASVNCTLTLLKSSIRKTQILRDGVYVREDTEDDRFNDYFGSLQSIVTSSAQNDSGLFETNLRDERYLPFENSGVVSEWQLELPANPSKNDPLQFDYNTISDVIIHLRYTAREGGGLLRNAAVANLKTQIESAQVAGSVRLFSLRHEFPTEWAKFINVKIEGATTVAELTLNLREEHYPFWSHGSLEVVKRADLLAKTTKNSVEITDKADGTGNKDTLDKDKSLGNLRVGNLSKIPLPAPTGKFTLYFNDNSMEDLWLALTWGKGI